MELEQIYLVNTLRIRHTGGPASAVMVSVGGRGYLVTARHVVSKIQAGENVLFRVDDTWQPLLIADVHLSETDDIAVLQSPSLAGKGLPEDRVSAQLTVGQAVVYCGFPLDLEGMAPEGHRWPIPLVKAAIFSGMINRTGVIEYYFDTVNNKGFSGGPIYARRAGGSPALVGIVSSYHYDRNLKVLQRQDDDSFEPTPDFAVRPNSGFMRAVPIARALEIISSI